MERDQRLLSRLAGLAEVFLKLGTLGFGGPAVHLAWMEDEVVTRRGWMSRQQFLDLVGVTHLIPGPNSTEMAIHIGLVRAGWLGLLVAGLSFILPAVLITACLAWLYVEYGSLPQVNPLFAGIQPVVLAIIFQAIFRLGRTAGRTWRRAGIGVAVALSILLGAPGVWALLAGGILGMLFLVRLTERNPRENRSNGGPDLKTLLASTLLPLGAAMPFLSAVCHAAARVADTKVNLWDLGLFFLKVGAVLYGGGYVLIAFLERDLVVEWEWLSQGELLDAIAIGQFTPGPILSTATFIGFQLAGVSGAIVATVGIFLPSFIFVSLLHPIIPRLRKGPLRGAFLDAINVSAVGLMAVALLRLGHEILMEQETLARNVSAWVMALAATFILLRWKISPVWLVIAGALVGWSTYALGG